MNNSTAILFFHRSNISVFQNYSSQVAIKLNNELNVHFKALIKSSGLASFSVDCSQQVGSTFGERYLNAMQMVFDQGFDQVISIGNDTPHLKLAHLTKAVAALENNDMCFGPSKDGGFYLWGLKKSCFSKQKFASFSWQKSSLLAEFKQHLISLDLQFDFLQTLRDLDHLADIKPLLDAEGLPSIIQSLLLQLQPQVEALLHSQSNSTQLEFSTYFNKGSPFSAN